MLSFWEKESFTQYDYLVIGGGLVGLSTAASLIEKHPKKKIAILERGIFPTGASTKNAGFACFGNPTELLAEIAMIGEEATVRLVAKRWQGLLKLRQRLSDAQIGFKQTGSHEILLHIPENLNEKIAYLNKLLQPIFTEKVFEIEKDEKITKFGFSDKLAKKLISNAYEGQLHTGKLIGSLQYYVQKKGVKIFNGCSVGQIKDFGNEVAVLVNQKIEFKARKIAVCTNAFATEMFPLPIKPGRGQILLTKPIKNLAIKGNFHFDEGFYYFRNVGKNQLLFGGGRNVDLEGETSTELQTTPKIIANLEEKLQTLILPNTPYEIEMTWAGIMAYTPNREPIVELCSTNIALGLALNGMGVAIGTLVGEQTAQLIAT